MGAEGGVGYVRAGVGERCCKVRFSVGRMEYRRRVWSRTVNTGYLTGKLETIWGVSLTW